MAVVVLAYYQYQAYQERKASEARKAFIENFLKQARQLADENRKHPFVLPPDPLAPAEDPLGRTPPSDAEEMANIKLWHQAPPAQRQKLIPQPEKPATPALAQAKVNLPMPQPDMPQSKSPNTTVSSSGDAMPEDAESGAIELQAIQAMQQKAMAAKAKTK